MEHIFQSSTTSTRRLTYLAQKSRSILKTNDSMLKRQNSNVIQIHHVPGTIKLGWEEKKHTDNEQSKDRIIINVSGKRFETFKCTLEKHPNTLLGNEKRLKYYYDELRKEYFFDRHRQSFEAILYYYQSTGRLRRPNFVPLDTFLEEMTFFDLGKDAFSQLRKDENLKEFRQPLLPRNRFRRYLWATLEYPEFSSIAKFVHTFLLITILTSTVGLAVESLPKYKNLDDYACNKNTQQANTTADIGSSSKVKGCAPSFLSPFAILQSICVGIFTLEFILRCITMPSLCSFIKSPMNWIDFLAIIPYYITIALRFSGRFHHVNGGAFTELLILRIFRLARFVKFYRVFKNVKAIRVLATTLRESMLDFLVLIIILTCLGSIFGAAAYFAESSDEDTKFDSIPIAIYWGIITITSVGYGDLAPTTAVGRVIACLCALSGAGVIAMLVSILVDHYQRVFTRKMYMHPEKIDFQDFSHHEEAIEIQKHGSNQNEPFDETNLENLEERKMEEGKTLPTINRSCDAESPVSDNASRIVRQLKCGLTSEISPEPAENAQCRNNESTD